MRGTAVVDKTGGIVGWTDNAGILFGLDGQMKGFTLRSPKSPVLYKENINFSVTISDGNIFIPLNCYDFIPLEKKELAARISSGPKATPMYIPSATSNGQSSSVRANETLSSRVIAIVGVREAGSASASRSSLSNSNSLSSSSSNSSLSSKISSVNSSIENRRRTEADQQEAQRRSSESNGAPQIFYAPSGTQPSNEIIFSNLTKKLILGERIFLSGAPITQKDSISLKYFSMSAPNELPLITKVYTYNIGYQLFAEADKDYNSSLKNFKIALEHYRKGGFMEAMQYAAQATKTSTNYVNAYILASASAKMNQYYDLALDYLNAVDDQEYKGQIEAL
ncbi:hypothetical protein [Pedobacter frigoris]|uniref:Uncharacterized protein n=1 Tax=Pedobacter frigoris TaxID=2571272 RepID=A0A4U1CG94_9SPHI|nr:hypothetical protein [Pedobacter frigoris]TKC06168.1 hypothetical protein FA047_12650 [Pedobacter frigoris]